MNCVSHKVDRLILREPFPVRPGGQRCCLRGLRLPLIDLSWLGRPWINRDGGLVGMVAEGAGQLRAHLWLAADGGDAQQLASRLCQQVGQADCIVDI